MWPVGLCSHLRFCRMQIDFDCLVIYTIVLNRPSRWTVSMSVLHGLVVIRIKLNMLSTPTKVYVRRSIVTYRLDKFTSSITVRFHSLVCRLWSTVLAHASMLIVCHNFKWQLFVSLERIDWWCLQIQQVRSEIIFYKSCSAALLLLEIIRLKASASFESDCPCHRERCTQASQLSVFWEAL